MSLTGRFGSFYIVILMPKIIADLRTKNKFINPHDAVSGEAQWRLLLQKGQAQQRVATMHEIPKHALNHGESPSRDDIKRPKPPMIAGEETHVCALFRSIRAGKPWDIKRALKKDDLGLSHSARSKLVTKARAIKREDKKHIEPRGKNQESHTRSKSAPPKLPGGEKYRHAYFLGSGHRNPPPNISDYLLSKRTPIYVFEDFYRGYSLPALSDAIDYGQCDAVNILLSKKNSPFSTQEQRRIRQRTHRHNMENVNAEIADLQNDPQRLAVAVSSLWPTDQHSPLAVVRAMTQEQTENRFFCSKLMMLENTPENYQAIQEAIQKGAKIPVSHLNLRLSRNLDSQDFHRDLVNLQKVGAIKDLQNTLCDYFDENLTCLEKADETPDIAESLKSRSIENITGMLHQFSKSQLMKPSSEGDSPLSIIEDGMSVYPPELQSLIKRKFFNHQL